MQTEASQRVYGQVSLSPSISLALSAYAKATFSMPAEEGCNASSRNYRQLVRISGVITFKKPGKKIKPLKKIFPLIKMMRSKYSEN